MFWIPVQSTTVYTAHTHIYTFDPRPFFLLDFCEHGSILRDISSHTMFPEGVNFKFSWAKLLFSAAYNASNINNRHPAGIRRNRRHLGTFGRQRSRDLLSAVAELRQVFGMNSLLSSGTCCGGVLAVGTWIQSKFTGISLECRSCLRTTLGCEVFIYSKVENAKLQSLRNLLPHSRNCRLHCDWSIVQ